jgi:hypothetical protein
MLLLANPTDASVGIQTQRRFRSDYDNKQIDQAKVIRPSSVQVQSEEEKRRSDEAAMLRIYREDQLALHKKCSEMAALIKELQKRIKKLEDR